MSGNGQRPDTGLAGESEFRQRLRALSSCPLEVWFTANRAQVLSVRPRPDGTRVLRLQHAFRAADSATLAALARFAVNPDASSRESLDRFVSSHQELFRLFSRPETPRRTRLLVQGVHVNLKKTLENVVRVHGLPDTPRAVTWSKGVRTRQGGRAIRFGSYSFKDHVIRVHPCLDDPRVPAFFIEYVLYHELLHALFPPVKRGGRRDVHNQDFTRHERLFYRYAEAMEYEARFVRECMGGALKRRPAAPADKAGKV
jgi:hypothetical protein